MRTIQQSQLPQFVVQSGFNSIGSIAVSRNGKLIATGGGPGSNIIKLSDGDTGLQLRTLRVNKEGIRLLDFSPDGSVLVSSDYEADTTIRFWNVRTGEELYTLREKGVDRIAFSPKEWLLIVGYTDRKFKLFDVRKREFQPNDFTGSDVAFSPDGETLAIADEHLITLESLKSGNVSRILKAPTVSINTVAFSPDGKKLVSGVTLASDSGKSNEEAWIAVWNLPKVEPFLIRSGVMRSDVSDLGTPIFTPDSRNILALDANSRRIKFWNARTGMVIARRLFAGGVGLGLELVLSADGRRLVCDDVKAFIRIWDMEADREIPIPPTINNLIWSLAFSPDGQTLAVGQDDRAIRLWDLKEGKGAQLFKKFAPNFDENKFKALTFMPNGLALVGAEGHENNIKLFNLSSGTEAGFKGHCRSDQSLAYDSREALRETCLVDSIGLGPSGPTVEVWDLYSDTLIFSRRFEGEKVASLSPDGQLLAVFQQQVLASENRFLTELRLIDISTREETVLREYTSYQEWQKMGSVTAMAFGPDRILATGNSNGAIELIDIGNHSTQILTSAHDSWVSALAFSKDGRILASGGWDGQIKLWDMAKRREICSLISLDKEQWVVVTPEGRFDTNKNLDYISGLQWVMPDDPLTALPVDIFMRTYYEPRLLPRLLANDDFSEVPKLADLNRVQPKVTITGVKKDGPDTASVAVEVESGKHTYQRGKNPTVQSGARDLRLFRDGQLVSYRDGDLVNQKQTATTGCEPVGGRAKKCKAIFEHIKLPRQKGVKDVEFSAYAFNNSNVKSETFRYPFSYTPKLPARKGRAYLISVGLSTYEDPDWNLKFAADDAHLVDETVAAKLRATQEYDEVVNVMLTSEDKVEAGQKVVSKSATKENIRKVLRLLAGEKFKAEEIREIPNAQKIKKATPDDVVLIFYSSHGHKDQKQFYLFPYDTGAGQGRDPEAVVPHSISSDDLYQWLRDIDAGDLVLVIDACYAAMVTGKEFKPGPIGSRGMGQLAYDKGMRILVATQPDSTAVEVDNITQQRKIQHGLLTFALVEDGLVDGRADSDGDKRILLTEWLEYGVLDVPKLYEEANQNSRAKTGGERILRRGSKQVRFISKGEGDSTVQQPTLFDFTRKVRRKRRLLVDKISLNRPAK